MQLTRWMAALGVTGALVVAGCGGDDEDEPAGGTSTPSAQETPAPTATEEAAPAGDDAKATFASTCGGCHTLAAADTSGQVGPSLDDLAPDKDRVLSAIAEGPGTMPSGLLEGAEAEAVAEFVSANAGG